MKAKIPSMLTIRTRFIGKAFQTKILEEELSLMTQDQLSLEDNLVTQNETRTKNSHWQFKVRFFARLVIGLILLVLFIYLAFTKAYIRLSSTNPNPEVSSRMASDLGNGRSNALSSINSASQRVRIGIRHPPTPLSLTNAKLPACERTFLYKFTPWGGLGFQLIEWSIAALIAKDLNYTMIIDDSNWNYGRFSDYFDIPPLPCQPPPEDIKRPLFKNTKVEQGDHIYSTMPERDAFEQYLFEKLDQQVIDVNSVWRLVNYREEASVLPAEQNLHYKLKPIFDAKSEAIRHIWRPNKYVLDEILKMKKDLNIRMMESLHSGPNGTKATLPATFDLESPMAGKLISVHFRLGDKGPEMQVLRPAYHVGMKNAFAHPKPFFEVIRSFVPSWKKSPKLPTLFLFSDNGPGALEKFNQYQSLYIPSQRFPILQPLEEKPITDKGWNQNQFDAYSAEVKKKMVIGLIRDITFAADNSDSIVCSTCSNICTLLFHLRGSQEIIGRNGSIRSVDAPWYPTSASWALFGRSLDPVKDHDKIFALVPELAKDERNYIVI